MALRTDAYYRTIAEDTVRRLGIVEPPVPILAIARDLAIPVREVSFPAFFSGSIIYEDGLPVILLNANKEERTQRTTLAHLLGHVLIVLSEPDASYPRDTVADHEDADTIAEELIVPRFLVLDQAKKWFNDYRYLARLFGVTESEMMDKMLDLGIIQQRGIQWDY